MLPRTVLVGVLVVAAMLVSTPTASACHFPPGTNVIAECVDWANPPFGVVPHVTDCSAYLGSLANALCNYTLEITVEILYGCPPGNTYACALTN